MPLPPKTLSDAEMMGSLPGAPGAKAVGTLGPDTAPAVPKTMSDAEMVGEQGFGDEGGKLPETAFRKALRIGGYGLKGMGKALNIPRALTTGPATAIAMGVPGEILPGLGKALNPTNLEQFPSNAELAQKAGLENPSLSDAMKSPYGVLPVVGKNLSKIEALQYHKPSPDLPWYTPEKGGLLDPTRYGTIEQATDPMNLLGAGKATTTAENLGNSAVRQALRNQAVTGGEQALKMPAVLDAAGKVATAPSNLIGALGRKFYGSGFQPVVYEGEKLGKPQIANTLYEAGIKTPLGLRGKADTAAKTLGNRVDNILQKAHEIGASQGIGVDVPAALRDIKSEVAKIKASGNDIDMEIAKALEDKIAHYENLVADKPAIPGTSDRVVKEPSSILNGEGRPIERDVVIAGEPGSPAIPGKKITPMESTGYKTSLYNSAPGAYTDAVSTPLGQRLRALKARGWKEQTEQYVADTLGNQEAKNVAELNSARGGILSTRKSQDVAQRQGARLADSIVTPTWSDTALGSIGMLEGPETVGKMLLAKKLGNALRFGTMPAGYGMQKFGESTAAAPAFNAWLMNKLKNYSSEEDKP